MITTPVFFMNQRHLQNLSRCRCFHFQRQSPLIPVYFGLTHRSLQHGFFLEVSSGFGYLSILHAVLKKPRDNRVFHLFYHGGTSCWSARRCDYYQICSRSTSQLWTKFFEYLKSADGKKLMVSGLFTRIQETVDNARKGIVPSVDPFFWRLHEHLSLWFMRIYRVQIIGKCLHLNHKCFFFLSLSISKSD